MSWKPLAQSRSKPKSGVPQHPITITCTKGGDTGHRRVFVTVRPDLLQDPPEFWQFGKTVTPLQGIDDAESKHGGYIRIIAGGTKTIKSSGGSGKTVAAKGLRITIPAWPEIAPGGHPATPPPENDYEYTKDWLEFRLPDWAAPAPSASKIAAVPNKDAKSEQQAKPAQPHHGKKAA